MIAIPFLDKIPALDRRNVRFLICVFNARVRIRKTSDGWRYDVTLP